MKISVVTTLYRSLAHVAEFHQRITAAVTALTDDYELIFVNDGSPDDSLAVVLALQAEDAHIVAVDLSRNFGHHKAIMTGLSYATGDLVFSLDIDLEEPPELLNEFHQVMTETDADAVYGVQENREGSLFKRVTGEGFYKIINALSPMKIPENTLIARLMTRRYVDALVSHREQAFIIAGLWVLAGYKQVPVSVIKPYKGHTTYTFTRRVEQMLFAVTSFSNRPLIYIAYLGLFIMLPAFMYIIVLLLQFFIGGIGVAGWASVIVSVWFLGGLTIFCLGIIAIYLSVIFTEVKDRPYTIVREVFRTDAP